MCVIHETMKPFLVFSLILAVYGIRAINSEKLSDVQLMALFEKRVGTEEFVNNIFNLPASQQLYVYEYLQDLIKNLKEDPETTKFLRAALKLLQQKTDDFHARHNLQKVPIEKFLRKRIDVQLRTAPQKSEEKLAKQSSSISTTDSKSNRKDSTAKSRAADNENKSSPSKKIAPPFEPKPETAKPVVKPTLLAKETFTSSETPIKAAKLQPSSNSKETKQKIQTPSPPRPTITTKPEKSSPQSKPTEKPSFSLKETVAKSQTPVSIKSPPSPPTFASVKKSPQSANENTTKSLITEPTSKKEKSLPKSEPEPVKKPSSSVTEGTILKASPSQKPLQNIQTNTSPTPANQSTGKLNSSQRANKAPKTDKSETSKAKSNIETQLQDEKKSEKKLVEDANTDGSKLKKKLESVAKLSFSV